MLKACHLDSAEYVLVKLLDGRQCLCHVRCLRLASVPRSLQNTLDPVPPGQCFLATTASAILLDIIPLNTPRLAFKSRRDGAYERQEQLQVFKPSTRKFVYHPTLHRTDTEMVVVQEWEGRAYEAQERLQVFKPFRRKFVYQSTQQTFCQLDGTDTETVVLQERAGGAYEGQEQLRVFKLFRRKYVYHPTQQTFKPLDAMPAHLPRQIFAAMEALLAINLAGDSWKDFNTAQVLTRRNMVVMYGNKHQLFQPNKIANFLQHMYPSVFIVQLLEVAYLMYRAYYWLPVMLGSLTVAAGVSLAVTLHRQQAKVMALVNHCRLTPVVQAGWVRAVSSHTLVPGDVVVLQRGKAMCDMVLLQGACLVVESMLSGEAAQVRKAAFVPEDGMCYNPDRHQSCTVYAGTTVQQVWNPEDAEDEVLAMVCRTGLNTQMGSMVRELVTPTTLPASKDAFVKDTFRLYAFALTLQLLNLICYAWRASAAYPQTPGVWAIKLVDTLTYSAPPSIPTIFLVLTYIARVRLDRAGISLLYSKALNVGAYVNMVCFDKTGTLTDSVAVLHGVLPVHKGQFESLQQNALRWNNRLRQALAVCNGLSWINKTLVGVDMERSMFKAVEARFLDRDVIVLPRKPDHVSNSRTAKLTITKTLDFSSQTLRSGVVVLADDALPGSALLFIRGAPGIIKDLVQPSSVPADFDQIRDEFSSNSFRLMAMAVGVIPDVHQLDLLRMTQQQVEAHVTHMELLCLMVLTNNIRPDSKSTITELQDGGGIRTMMITGDYHHTAIAVARDVGMLSTDAQMIIIDIARGGQPHAGPQGQIPQGFYPQRPAGSAQGLFGEAPGQNAGGPEEGLPEHSLEAQLSMAANCPGHTGSWADEEGEGGHFLPGADSVQSLVGLGQNSPDQQQPSGLLDEENEARDGQSPAGPMLQGPSQQQPLPEHGRRRRSTMSEQETNRLLSAEVPHDDTCSGDHRTVAAAATEAAPVTRQPAAESPTKPIRHAVIHRSSLKRVALPSLAQPTSHTPLPIAQSSRKKVTIRQSPASEAKPSSGFCMSPGQGSDLPEHRVLTSSADHQSTSMSSAVEEEESRSAQTVSMPPKIPRAAYQHNSVQTPYAGGGL
ncbi:TPA: hypothetical protein ACH3X1_014592 [Trebouxia sp. C0004]